MSPSVAKHLCPRRVAAALLLTLAATTVASARLTQVSVNDADVGGNQESENPSVSDDGRFVAFKSQSDNLDPLDGDTDFDVFVRDLRRGKTSLVSANHAGTSSGDGEAWEPTISGNGRWVAFTSDSSDLVENDGNHSSDVFVRDLRTRTTTLVSVNRAGGSGNNGSEHPVISRSGRFVAFESDASDLVDNDGNGVTDVFVRDLEQGSTVLVSVKSDGSSGSGASMTPVITPNGRYVAFVSAANDLVANDSNALPDVFLRDLENGSTTLVSVHQASLPATPAWSSRPFVTPDGRFVAFTSDADDLVPYDRNGTTDGFVRDVKKGTTTLVSAARGSRRSANGQSFPFGISADGRVVGFESGATNLTANDHNAVFLRDVFVRNLRTRKTQLVSVSASGKTSGDRDSTAGHLSADGRIVVFESEASNLVAPPIAGHNVFARDLAAGKTILLSANVSGTSGGNSWSFEPQMTRNGRVAVFSSFASDLVDDDANQGDVDVFLCEVE